MNFLGVLRITFYLLKCQKKTHILDSLRCSKLMSRNKAESILLDKREATNCSYRYILPQMPFFSEKSNQYPSFNSKYLE